MGAQRVRFTLSRPSCAPRPAPSGLLECSGRPDRCRSILSVRLLFHVLEGKGYVVVQRAAIWMRHHGQAQGVNAARLLDGGMRGIIATGQRQDRATAGLLMLQRVAVLCHRLHNDADAVDLQEAQPMLMPTRICVCVCMCLCLCLCLSLIVEEDPEHAASVVAQAF